MSDRLDPAAPAAEAWLDSALARLKALLPPQYEVRPEPQPSDEGGIDAVWELRDTESGVYTQLIVETKHRLGPATVAGVLSQRASLLRRLTPNTIFLVVAPWLGPRTRTALEQERLNYLDLTGNTLLQVRRPAVFVRTEGAHRDPAPADRGAVRLTGARANRLVRALVDVRPPYRASELVTATRLSPGYVSRALDSLAEQALIQRHGRGPIQDVDWEGLLRLRAESYDLFKVNRTRTYTSQRGWTTVLESLPPQLHRGAVAVTGSVAATQVWPVAAPQQLVLYVEDSAARDGVERAARLLPVSRGGDVVLAVPADRSQMWGTNGDDLPRVALSQLALDCLGGNGRLPEEGAAVLDWMRQNDSWRCPDLAALGWPRP